MAGAAPIIGPGIAVIWGWLPAFLWVIIGTMFFAGVHDFGAIWASVRSKARSVGSLTGDVVTPRARTLFMIVVFFLLMMVNAVFAVAISDAFQQTPSSVIPAWTAVFVAVVIGILIYRMGVPLLWPTIVGTVILYAVIYLGEAVPISLTAGSLGLPVGAQWILILFLYAGIASLLPVWLLLQPRDYINGIQLFVGLGLLYGAVLIANPTIIAPAINPNVAGGGPTDVSLAVRDDCVRRNLRFPRPGRVWHHLQAAEQGDRRPLRGLPGLVRRGCPGTGGDHRCYGRF